MKVAYVLSYNQPKYVRTQFIVQTIESLPNVRLHTAVNTSTSVLRYVQTLAKLFWLRASKRPDVYILGFRGMEIYWPVRLLTIGKPLVYDEFLNPYLWIVEEHKKVSTHSLAAKLLRAYVRSIYMSCALVLSDTDIHARYSIEQFSQPSQKFLTLYVGTDEEMFAAKNNMPATKTFNVFFYGRSFLPLHGLDQIIEAAQQLEDEPHINFTIIGGAKRKKDMDVFLAEIKKRKLKNVDHKPWVQLEELPGYIDRANLCLGGPFGNTPQGQKVITGKTYQFLAMGKPTLIGLIDEEVGFKDGVNCLAVKQGNTDELAAKILWAYHHQDQLGTIGKMGKELYQSVFSQRIQAKKLDNALKKIVG